MVCPIYWKAKTKQIITQLITDYCKERKEGEVGWKKNKYEGPKLEKSIWFLK